MLGGDIVVGFNGEVVRSAEELMLRFRATRAGEKIALSVVGPDGRREVAFTVPEMVH